MRISKPLRARGGAKRIDLTPVREALKDGRQWCGLGVVVQPTDGSPHWRIETDPDTGEAVDVLVWCVLQPSQIPLEARLAAGMWIVPGIGEEVAVVIPAGRVDFMPLIVALLSSNSVPNGGGQGPSPTAIVIARGAGTKVYIHDGQGGAEPLVKKSEFDGHTHPPGSFNAPSGGGPVTGTSGGAASVTGTQVLEAK